MSASDLIKQFQSEGALERRGEFQVDRDKARQKMQKFQLPDPHTYVLELVKFATILGATKIDFFIDADEMRMKCDCDPLTVEDLDNLYGAAFSKLKSPRQRALRHLAIGLTAADAFHPALLQIRSTGEEGGGRYDVSSKGEVIEEMERGPRETEIYIKEKFRAGHIVDFFSSLSGSLAEHHHLRTRCRYSPLEIVLNSKVVSFGISSDARFQAVIDTPTENGLIWLLDSGVANSKIEILQNGVVISTHLRAAWGAAFRAVVESSRLTTDLTQSAFVEDEAFENVMNHLIVRAHDRLLHDKFMSIPVSNWGREHETVVRLARQLIRDLGRSRSLGVKTPRGHSEIAQKMEAYPLLPIASLQNAEDHYVVPLGRYKLVSMKTVREHAKVYVSSETFPGVSLPDKPLVLFAEAEGARGQKRIGTIPTRELARYLGMPLENVTEELRTRAEWLTNRRKWEHQHWPKTLKDDVFPVQKSFVEHDLSCHLGVRLGAALPSTVAWVKEGRLLSQSSLPSKSLPWLSILIVGDFEANAQFDGPAANKVNRAVALRAMQEIPNLMEKFAATALEKERYDIVPQFRRYLDVLSRRGLHSALATALDLPDDPRLFVELAERSAHWKFGPCENAEEFAELVDGLGPIARLPIFTSLAGELVTMKMLADDYLERGAIFVVHERHRSEGVAEAYELARDEVGLAIWSDNNIDRFLYHLASDDAQSANKRIRFQASKIHFMNRKALAFELPERAHLSQIEVDDEVARVLIGLRAAAPLRTPGTIHIDIRYENRAIEALTSSIDLGDFDVVVNATKVYPTPDFDEIEEGEPKLEMLRRIRERCVSVLHSWVRHHGAIYGRPAELGENEEVFWSFVEALYEKDAGPWLDIVVARRDDGTEITIGGLNSEVRHGKLAFGIEGRERVEELITSPGYVETLTVRPHTYLSVFVKPNVDLIDITKTRKNLAILEGAEERFMAKQPISLQIHGSRLSNVEIDEPNVRGNVALVGQGSTKERELGLDLCFRGRFVETRRILAPFGQFTARIVCDDFELNPTWNKIQTGYRPVFALARAHAQRAVIEFCENWDRNPRTALVKERQALLHFLGAALVDANDARTKWPHACKRLEETRIFRTADGEWRDFRYLKEIEEEYGAARWLNDHNLTTESWRGVESSSVVIIENGVEDIISTLSMIRWDHAKDIAAQMRQAGPGSRDTEREPLEGLGEPVTDEQPTLTLGIQLVEMLRLVRAERQVLLGDSIISTVDLRELDHGEVAEIQATSITLNRNHPVVKEALDYPDDPIVLAFLGSSVYTAINVFYREVTDEHEVEFQTRFARWVRSIVDPTFTV